MLKPLIATALFLVGTFAAATDCFAEEYESGMKWAEPPIITPGKTDSDPPSDAIILFDGKDLSAWEHGDKWIVKDGVATVKGEAISTKQKFGDCQLHIEWSAPTPAKGSGQGRGNSGVFLMGHYELQVLDSYGNKTYFDGQASAIYKQTPPLVNVMRPPGEWNAYDVIWTAPKFKKDGSVETPAYITALQNGVLTQNHTEIQGDTFYNKLPAYEKHGKGPILIQNHGDPVRYRNIWIREIKPAVGEREREPYIHHEDTNTDTPARKSANVNGDVRLDHKNLDNATIKLYPKFVGKTLSAEIKAGKYDFGAISPGIYTVTIEPKGNAAADSKIPLRYRDQDTAEITIDVKEGTTGGISVDMLSTE